MFGKATVTAYHQEDGILVSHHSNKKTVITRISGIHFLNIDLHGKSLRSSNIPKLWFSSAVTSNTSINIIKAISINVNQVDY